jgi:outer membrane biosynthesis protein TonB
MLSDEAYALVKDTVQSDTVQSILGNGYSFEVPETETEATPEPEIPKAPPVVEKPAAKAKPKAEPKPEPKPAPAVADVEVEGLSLDDLNFDD